MRYHLRTLMIVVAILPPLLWFGWTRYEAWRAERELRKSQLERVALFYVMPTSDAVLVELLKLSREAETTNGPPASPTDRPSTDNRP